MKIYEKNIKDINIDDLRSLIDDETVEDNYLEYKSKMVAKEEENNILRTICGFANNNGGLLIYGLKEEKGIPKYAEGVDLKSDWDTEKLRYYNLIDKIEPKITIEIERIPIPNTEKSIILFKVPPCRNTPYRVNNKKFKDFYKRYDGKTVSIPYNELKDIFKNKEEQFEKINDLQENRLNKISSTYSKPEFNVVFHSIPLYYNNIDLDMESVRKYCHYNRTGRYRPNVSGIINATDYSTEQIFRNGICEIIQFCDSKTEITSFRAFENLFKKFITDSIELYKHEELFQPIVFFVSYVNISKFKNQKQNRLIDLINNDKNIISNKIVIYDYNEEIDAHKIFVPIFNHFGYYI